MRKPSLIPVLALLLILLLGAAPARAERYALIVGINEYPHFAAGAQLSGCVNDARLMRGILTGHFGFAESNIKVLLNGEASAEGIRAAFRSQLVERSKPGDTVVFYYSGHGSQLADQEGDEDDGKDEILCPNDLAKEGGEVRNAIRDDELAALAKQLAGREFLAIFDCCHSGTGMRDVLCAGRARWLPLDQESPRAATRGLDDLDEATLNPLSRAGARSGKQLYRDMLVGVGGAIKAQDGAGGSQVLIAACLAGEKAQENEFNLDGRREDHGALTAKLATALEGEAADVGNTITYGALKHFLEGSPLITEQREQHPQVECASALLERKLFGAAPAARPQAAAPAPAHVAEVSEGGPEEETVGMMPLKVFVAPYAALTGKEAAGNGGETAGRLKDYLGGLACVKPVAERAASDATVFYSAGQVGGGANYVVGTILPGGGVSTRLALTNLSGEALAPLGGELKRIWLVENLARMRNPGSGYGVQVELASGGDILRNGQRIAFRIRSRKSGYLTVINVDCKGGVHQLVPNDVKPSMKIEAGEPLTIPSGEFELVVEPPVGREFIKVLVTARPLTIPTVAHTRSIGGIRSLESESDAGQMINDIRAIVSRPKVQPAAAHAGGGASSNASVSTSEGGHSSSEGGAASSAGGSERPSAVALEKLGEKEWGEASFVFVTRE